MRCKNCLRTVWEQASGLPGGLPQGSGNYYHHHNGSNMCFPFQVAEVDPNDSYEAMALEPELSGVEA
jgi:hypothetical protein